MGFEKSGLKIAAAVAACGLLATPTAAFAKAAITQTSGIINLNGTINAGSGFTSQRLGAGDYLITFPKGAFPTKGPAMTCSAFGANGGVPTCLIWQEIYNPTKTTTFEIRIYAPNGTLFDNNFQFVLVTTS